MVVASDRPNALVGEDEPIRLQLAFDVLRVDLPVGEVRHAQTVWNYVDETQTDPRMTALLARNGFRIGTADEEVWPALRVLFEANQAKSRAVRHVAQGGAPLSLRLGDLEDGESLFEYLQDGRLVGRSFDGGAKFLHIDYALDPADPTRTIMMVTPEVRKFSADKHWQHVGGRFREAPQYEGRLFTELSTQLSLRPGEFLVVGPSESARLPSLVGSRFLTARENDVTCETILCLSPRPLRMRQSAR